MPRPKESERKDIRTLVLDAAERIFLEHGYGGITIRRIAGDIGYTPGTIYLYFKNKDQIIGELRNQGFRLLYQYKERFIADGVSGPMDRLRKGGRSYIAFALENPDYYDLMFNLHGPDGRGYGTIEPAGDQDARARDYSMQSFLSLKEAIQWCQAEGFLPGVDPDLAAFAFWSTVHGMVSLIIRKRIPYTYEPSQELADQAINFFMDLVQNSAAVQAGNK